ATEAPKPPSAVAPGAVPPAREALIMVLLAKSPAERPAAAADVLRALEGIATPPMRMTAETPRPAPPRAKTPWWPAVTVAVAAIAGFAILGVRMSARSRVDAEARARFDAIVAANGDPPTPDKCRSNDGGLIERLARAGAWLQESAAGAPRPQDRDALALLSTIHDADGSAEYWSMLSRARLVVEPTPDGALAAAKRAVERCPEMALAHNAVGGAELRAHDDAAAGAAFKQAITIAPDYTAPRFNLGLLALRAKDAAAAVAAFDAVLAKDPLHPRAHLARGQARMMSGDFAGALDDLEQSTLRHPSDGDAWLLLGKAREASGAQKTAMEAFCKAKSLGVAGADALCPTG
ncbi:MAG TPA: tetratricopeptide repeat protein, partial [Polyangia bacterium]